MSGPDGAGPDRVDPPQVGPDSTGVRRIDRGSPDVDVLLRRWADIARDQYRNPHPDPLGHGGGDGDGSAAGERPEPSAFVERLRSEVGDRPVAVAWHRDAGRSGARLAFAGLRRSRHPLTGARELTLLCCVAETAEALRCLLAGLDELDGGERPPITFELDPPEELREEIAAVLDDLGYVPRQILVSLNLVADDPSGEPADPDRTPVPAGDGVCFRPMEQHEAGFVRDCLAVAVRRGLAGVAPVVDLPAWIRHGIPLPPAADVLCVIGAVDADPVCHALGRIGTDPLTGAKYTEVIDTFVIPERRAGGLSHRAAGALLDAARSAGCRSARSSAVVDGTQERLVAGLARAGWKEVGRQWHQK